MDTKLNNCYTKDKQEMYRKIIKRASDEGLDLGGDTISRQMDLVCADYAFNLRLEDWLNADKFNFAHDWYGIMDSINRSDGFPTKDFGHFLPRFAGKDE